MGWPRVGWGCDSETSIAATLQALLASSNEGILILDASGNIQKVNPTLCTMFVCSAEHLEGHSIADILPGITLEWLESARGELHHFKRTHAQIETNGRRRNGEAFPIELTLSTVADSRFQYYLLLLRDATDRMQAQEAARLSEQKFRSLVAATTSVVWNASEGGYFYHAQPSWKHYTGQSWESHAMFGWLEAIHPDDREGIRDSWYATIRGRSIFETSCRLWNAPSQQYRYVELRAVPILNADTSVYEWLGTVTDIQSRIESEQSRAEQESMERFNKLIDNVPGMVYQLLVRNDQIVAFPYVSPGAIEILLIEPFLLQQTPSLLLDLIHPNDRASFMKALRDAEFDHTPAIWEGRILIEGEIRWVQSASRPELQAGGATLWNGLLMDVTERKMLEAQLGQAQKLESIGHLAAGIAHEINTPIQYIGDNIHFLDDLFADFSALLNRFDAVLDLAEQGRLHADTIVRERAALADSELDYLITEIPKAIEQSLEGISHVAHIVRAMKEFSHPGTDEKHLIDLNHAIETTITIARNEWKYVAEMEARLAPDLPLVPCLPDQLNQVMLNLIVNAAHAIEEVADGKKGRITITTNHTDHHVEVHISDTGTGIPPEIRKRVFDPFFTTKAVGKGTGQGLAIAYAVIVDKHGGTLDFVSTEGEGTTFTIQLPLHE